MIKKFKVIFLLFFGIYVLIYWQFVKQVDFRDSANISKSRKQREREREILGSNHDLCLI